MKTAISLPDEIFEEAERFAKRHGMSRSELYAKAVRQYLTDERFVGVRERLDAIYSVDPSLSELDSFLQLVQVQSVPEDSW